MVSSPESSSPRSFLDFPKLPIEIRERVWEMSVPPRDVILSPHRIQQRKNRNIWTVRIQAEPITKHAVLRVSREARIATLRTYTRFDCVKAIKDPYRLYFFSTSTYQLPTHDAITYIDIYRDRIVLESSGGCNFDIATSFLGNHLGNIRRLAISFSYCHHWWDVYPKLRKLRHLRELIFVGSVVSRTVRPFGTKTVGLKDLELTSGHPEDVEFRFDEVSAGYYDPTLSKELPSPCREISLADFDYAACKNTKEWDIIFQETH